MTHLYIELNTGLTEEVDNKTIEKLYKTVTENTLDETSNLKGRLHSVGAHEVSVEYLTQNFPLLFIQVDKLYINFEDPEVEQVLLQNNIGDGEGVTRLEAASSNIGTIFGYERSTIKKFNEFRYFNKNIPDSCFCNCTTLLSIILPDECTTIPYRAFFMALEYYNTPKNLTYIGGLNHISNFKYECFQRLYALVINEEDIAGAVTIDLGAFWYVRVPSINCPKLTSLGSNSFRENNNLTEIKCLGKINSIPSYVFNTCKGLQTATLPYECTEIKNSAFSGCSSLTTLKLYTSSVDEWVEGETPEKSTISRVTSFRTDCFSNCSSLLLTSNDIENATVIESGAFRGTAFYGDLSIPHISGDLGNNMFRDCKSLTSISNLGNITSICKNARSGYAEGSFNGCTSLTSVVIPSTVTIIGASAFADCPISNINITWENITKLGNSAFSSHADWNFIVNLANLTNISYNFLGKNRGTDYIRLLYIPKVESGNNAEVYYSDPTYYKGNFAGISTDILYFKNIKYFYPGDFSHTSCTNLVINNTTPPEWRNQNNKTDEEITNQDLSKTKVFSGSTINNIYVPDSAVSTYLSDSNWSTLADKIKPLSQLAKVATEANLQEGLVALIEAYM